MPCRLPATCPAGAACASAAGWSTAGAQRSPCRRRPPSGPIQRIGGATGWYYGDWLWRLRGFLDLLVGGVGVRRERRHPERLRVGDALDFWRVEAFEPARRLRLHAEMKVPGRAWLQFEVDGDEDRSTIRQTAVFDRRGSSVSPTGI